MTLLATPGPRHNRIGTCRAQEPKSTPPIDSSTMKTHRPQCLLLAALLWAPAAFAQAAAPASGVVQRAEQAVSRGAQAAARGVETGAHAAARAIQHGASVAASGVERGVKTAAGVASSVVGKVTGSTAPAPKP